MLFDELVEAEFDERLLTELNRMLELKKTLPEMGIALKKMQELCKLLKLEMVPIEEIKENFDYDSVEVLLERAKGKYASGMNKEGIVIGPIEPVYSKTIEGPLSMKVLNNDYLLKD